MISIQQLRCFKELAALSINTGVGLFLVGGAVRDLLRGRALLDSDLDILVDGDACQFAAIVAPVLGAKLKVFSKFYTAKLVNPSTYPEIQEIDFASSRSEVYEAPGTLPKVRLAPLTEDLRRRDFSINAIAIPISLFVPISECAQMDLALLRDSLIDPFSGQLDLEQRLIRILHPGSFSDDPTRLYRALRYQLRIGGELEKETRKAFVAAIHDNLVVELSLRRRFNELVKILSEQQPIVILERALRLGLMDKTLSPHPIDGDVFASLLIRALAATDLNMPLSPQIAFRMLLFSVIACCSSDLQDVIFQSLAVAKKARHEMASEWKALEHSGHINFASNEAIAVFGARDKPC